MTTTPPSLSIHLGLFPTPVRNSTPRKRPRRHRSRPSSRSLRISRRRGRLRLRGKGEMANKARGTCDYVEKRCATTSYLSDTRRRRRATGMPIQYLTDLPRHPTRATTNMEGEDNVSRLRRRRRRSNRETSSAGPRHRRRSPCRNRARHRVCNLSSDKCVLY